VDHLVTIEAARPQARVQGAGRGSMIEKIPQEVRDRVRGELRDFDAFVVIYGEQ
jgi:hypothetical protein